ncbi:hypothetical protein BKA62DRAFT_699407, partial [Auriculariales sp. MPI-PUGE-AT-0066]
MQAALRPRGLTTSTLPSALMAAIDDREALWAYGRDEPVEVNQRALIDKVLARYAGEFTVFRELLQNADDAEAEAAEIHFRTQDYLNGNASNLRSDGELVDIKTVAVHEHMFRNSGDVFGEADWQRLRKIADGNPDEEKIGAFGVGFYSVFSGCDEPTVTSGSEWMAFHFDNVTDQLLVRNGTRDGPTSVDGIEWTEFRMPLRQPSPLPNMTDLARFTATSLTFMRKLSSVSLWFNGFRLSAVKKTSEPEQELDLPPGLAYKSTTGAMKISRMTSRPLCISADVSRWMSWTPPAQAIPPARSQTRRFRSRPPAISAVAAPEINGSEHAWLSRTTSEIALSVYSAHAEVSLDPALQHELHRSTKKNPPRQVRVDVLYTRSGVDAVIDANINLTGSSNSVFRDLQADLHGSGTTKIFIGHITGQTTGFGSHLSAMFIPTVERESLDFQDQNVSVWNRELLSIGGHLLRAVYELQMTALCNKLNSADDDKSASHQQDLEQQATQLMKFFAFHPSHPSPVVSEVLENAFLSAEKPLPLISTRGVLDVTKVRRPSRELSFLTSLPVVPTSTMVEAGVMINSLLQRDIIQDISLADSQLVACLRWWLQPSIQKPDTTRIINPSSDLTRDAEETRDFKESCAFFSHGSSQSLTTIKTYIPTDVGYQPVHRGPFPTHTLPYEISKNLLGDDSITKNLWQAAIEGILKWTPLPVFDWLTNLIKPETPHASNWDITTSSEWAETVLRFLANRDLERITIDKGSILNLLADVRCIPTTAGIVKPHEAYFPNASMFSGLPIVKFPSMATIRDDMDRLLSDLGVQKRIDVDIIIADISTRDDWDASSLATYLCELKPRLSDVELERIAAMDVFRSESTSTATFQQYKLEDLYEPVPYLRDMNLPILLWKQDREWRPNSDEARLLSKMGLKKSPSLQLLLGIASGRDQKARASALDHLLENITSGKEYASSYDPAKYPNLEFIPAFLPNGRERFGSPECAALGFTVLRNDTLAKKNIRDYAQALKVPNHPNPELLVEAVKKYSPSDPRLAKQWFDYLASRQAAFSPSQFNALKLVNFIPATKGLRGHRFMSRVSPTEVFFGPPKRGILSHLFLFVDFGSDANKFLRNCGVADEPSLDRVVLELVADPQRYFKLAGGYQGFMAELRVIAAERRAVSSSTIQQLRNSPAFVATKLVPKRAGAQTQSDDLLYEVSQELMLAADVIINDHPVGATLFASQLFIAPQEDSLEAFYAFLGSPRLSSLIHESFDAPHTSQDPAALAQCQRIRTHVLDCLTLFFDDIKATSRKLLLELDWFSAPGNFVVHATTKITQKVTFLNDQSEIRDQDVSARVWHRVITGEPKTPSPIELLLSETTPLDMSEVARGLCRLILHSPRLQDSLLLLFLLTTDRESLRKRGYNIDLTLRKRDMQESIAEDDYITSKLPQSPSSNSQDGRKPSEGLYSLFGQKFRIKGPGSIGVQVNGSSADSPKSPEIPLPADVVSLLSRPEAQITPWKLIDMDISRALALSRMKEKTTVAPPRSPLVNEGRPHTVTYSITDLQFAAYIAGVKFHVHKDISSREMVVQAKTEAIGRFAAVVNPLRHIFNLPQHCIQIFYDASGSPIAINRNGNIFLNLRHYEAWHDDDVRANKPANAHKSWFLAIAREIACNIADREDAEHGFHFSTISQAHVEGLAALLTQPN